MNWWLFILWIIGTIGIVVGIYKGSLKLMAYGALLWMAGQIYSMVEGYLNNLIQVDEIKQEFIDINKERNKIQDQISKLRANVEQLQFEVELIKLRLMIK